MATQTVTEIAAGSWRFDCDCNGMFASSRWPTEAMAVVRASLHEREHDLGQAMPAEVVTLAGLYDSVEAGLATAWDIAAPASAGFPDASNTGPSGTLTPSGSVVTTSDGQIVEDLDVTGTIEVRHDNVVVRNCRVSFASQYGVYVPYELRDSVVGLQVDDTAIVGVGGARDACIPSYGQWTVSRCDLSGSFDGMKMGAGLTVQDSYIHGLHYVPGSHNDGIQIGDGAGIAILRNTIINPYNQTSAILVKADFGAIDDVLIQGNLLAGGGYTVYGGVGYGDLPDATNVRILDNAFSASVWDKGGFYFHSAYSAGVAEWSGNYWFEDSPLHSEGEVATSG